MASVIGSPLPRRYSSAPATCGTWGKAAPLGEETPDLEVGVDPLLGTAEELEEEPVAEDHRRVGLLGLQGLRLRVSGEGPSPS